MAERLGLVLMDSAEAEFLGATRHGERPPLRGWLAKRKTNRLIGGGLNHRFFTVDFGAHLLYYRHNEGGKQSSLPTPFRDILGVEPAFATAESSTAGEPPTMQRSNSKGSLTSKSSRLPRLPVFRKTAEKHGFVLRTREKTMELQTTCREEAEMWIAGLREAMDMSSMVPAKHQSGHCGGSGMEMVSTAPGSSRPSSRNSIASDVAAAVAGGEAGLAPALDSDSVSSDEVA
jgi:hypothetical protein